MTRRIKLKKFHVPNVDYLLLSAFRLRIEASEAEGLDERIFLWRREPPNPHTSEVRDTFFTIASPVDMEEFPPEEPDPLKAYPFFRRAWVELDFRAVSQAEEAWLLIVREANLLLIALDKLEGLRLAEEVWIGSAPEPEDGSESDSEEA